MSHVRDTWTRPTADGGRIPTARHGRGRRWLAVWTGPDGRRYSKAWDQRAHAAQHAAEMQAGVAVPPQKVAGFPQHQDQSPAPQHQPARPGTP